MKKLMIALSAMLFVTSCNNVTELPQVTTNNPVVSDTAVIVGGEVIFTGGDNKTTRGVCWSTSPNPTTADNFMLDASKGAGVYSFDILGQLMPNTNYYFKAFAENSVGKAYGSELYFETSYGNPNNAFVNAKGCVQCDNYAVGDTFELDGKLFVVANTEMLRTAGWAQQDMSQFCVSKVEDLGGIFKSSVNGNIQTWDVSNVKYMDKLFNEVVFNQDIGNWDVSNVEDMHWMFRDCDFNQDISSWDVSNVASFHAMFSFNASFNQDIGNWVVSNVTDMGLMFYQAFSFNQDLSDWCVTNISSTPNLFSTNSALTASNHPVWGTCP